MWTALRAPRGVPGRRRAAARRPAAPRGLLRGDAGAAADRAVRLRAVRRRDRRRRGRRHRPDRAAARPRRQRRLGGHLPLRGLRPRRDRPRAGHRPDARRGRLVLADRGARRARRDVRRARPARSPGWPRRASAGWPTRAPPPSSRSAPRGPRSATRGDGLLDLGPHVEAWGELLCTAAGLPPVPEGVAAMPSRRGQRGRG